MLEKKYHQKISCVGVEIDAEIIRLAEKYVLPDLECPIELFCCDAGDFMTQCHTTFDVICVDLFLDALVPPQFEETTFLKMVQKALAPEGILIYNKLAYSDQDKAAAATFFDTKFKEVFPSAMLFDAVGNYMLLNRPVF
jgi:spermidine synthase